MKQKENKENSHDLYRDIAPYLGLGFQLAASVVIMLFLGNWLDKKLSLFPLLTIAFSVFGSAAGLYSVIKTILELNRKKKE